MSATRIPPAFRTYGEETLPQAPAAGPGKRGVLEATLAREPGGSTRLVRDRVEVPYHLTGTLETDPAPGMTTLCAQEPTGGVAQGDRHRLAVGARERARVHVTTQSATKVHSMTANYAHLAAELRAGPDAHLEYLPGPVIVNEDARCLGTTRVDLAEDATVVVSDVLVPDGLSEHEPFSFDHYHASLEARVEGDLVCADAVDLRPAERDPRDPASVGEYGVVGTLYALAPSVDAEGLADRLHDRVAGREDVLAGASRLPRGAGASVRVLGNRTTAVEAAVRAAWDETRLEVLGVGAPADRREP